MLFQKRSLPPCTNGLHSNLSLKPPARRPIPTTSRQQTHIVQSSADFAESETELLKKNLENDRAARMSVNDFYEVHTNLPSSPSRKGNRPIIKQLPRGSAAAVVLGGAQADSRRLYPLTQNRTLPAVPFICSYRLIDIVLSNLVNSNVRKIFVLTQFNSKSLNSYLQQAYDLGSGIQLGGEGYVEVVAAAQMPQEQRFAEGSADVVRQWLHLFESNSKNKWVEDILVLPSDQVYKMDFTQLLDFHKSSDADVTIVCKAVEEHSAQLQGIVKLDGGARIQSFVEKPNPEQLAAMRMGMDEIADFYHDSNVDEVPFEVNANPDAKVLLGSCGMYVFRKDVLHRLLDTLSSKDIGNDLIPAAVSAGLRVMAFNHAEFWSDIGSSIASFYDFTIGMARDEVPFSLQQPLDTPFYHSPTCLPPISSSSAKMNNVIMGSGCELGACIIKDTTLGPRTIIGDGCNIEGAVLMGSSFYEHERVRFQPQPLSPSFPPMGIGAGTLIRRAIFDKNVRIGKFVQLVNKDDVQESVGQLPYGICIKDGIIVVPKNAVIPDRFCL